ncbi:MAG: homoserine dehydrogenase [Candidatus Hecatellales archaeon]|nr:MAG: homoserine dehydrogenase [Candidatus Hecatellales archaeon]
MRIILVGFGTVGQSFVKLLSELQQTLQAEYGINPRVVAAADRGGVAVNVKGLNLERLLEVKKAEGTVAAYPEGGQRKTSIVRMIEETPAEVLVEVTPTNIEDGEPGMSHIMAALRSGKHVVTANKGPMALAFQALMELAEYNGVVLRFSGCVGGGTPVIDFAGKCLLGDKITSIRGILNGTTNYILTRMAEEGLSFEQALEEAQKAGYAEADPSMDVDGWDSACKLVILANWVLKRKVRLENVKVEGIRGVTVEDVEEASARGERIKLIAYADEEELKVSPETVPVGHPLCVSGVLNAVCFTSKYAGEETVIGKGAGGMETASAILRDLINIKRFEASIG